LELKVFIAWSNFSLSIEEIDLIYFLISSITDGNLDDLHKYGVNVTPNKILQLLINKLFM